MGWQIGYDERHRRDIGYGVPAFCDHPGCWEPIDRGLPYVCGSMHRGGDHGCGLYFCNAHRHTAGDKRDNASLCGRCYHGRAPFLAKVDHPMWIEHKLRDASWKQWRAENPREVGFLKLVLRPFIEEAQEAARHG